MFAILGYGRQAKAIVKWLLENTSENITTVDHLVDITPTTARHKHIKGSLEKDYHWYYDGAENLGWERNDKNVVISCLPTEKNYKVLELCQHWDCDYLDLGGDTNLTRKIINDVKKYEWKERCKKIISNV